MTATQSANAIRNRKIIQDRKEGMSLRLIGELYGITAERVNQIVGEANLGIRFSSRRGGGGNKLIPWSTPNPPRLTWRHEIAARLRDLRDGKVGDG